ncbi:MAG: ROK family transcriptional regulator [Clostridia bacterium]|nr:ROK family transcriptional regulator [Clostridia bacterium]
MRYEGDNMAGVRRGNRAAVLQCLRHSGGLSRKRLSEQLGLTPAALTNIAAELIDEGLVVESGAVPSGAVGRREITLELYPFARCALGVHLGLGSAILSAVWLNGEVLFSETVPLPLGAPAEETVRKLSERLLALAAENGISRERMLGVGVAVRGAIREDGRTVQSSFDTLDAKNFPICDRFEAYTGLKATLSNNVRALFAAEMFLAGGDAPESAFFLRCEAGIGAAVSVEDRIWFGAHRMCAEIGHIPVIRRGGKPCHCGKSGCLETIASPTAIREDAQLSLSPVGTPLLWQLCGGERKRVTTALVLDAARGGDHGASQIVDRAVHALGDALKSAIYLLDPAKILLYGDIFEHPYYLSRLTSEMDYGMDPAHTAPIEKSRYNGKLEDKAAGILVAEQFLKNGGSIE